MGDTARPSGAMWKQSGGAERRRHRRFLPRECDLSLMREAVGILKVFGMGAGKDNLAAAVVDLSEGGARFITKSKLTIGTRVSVTIGVRLFNDTIKTTGTVCWASEHTNRAAQYYAAVNFDKLDAVQARKIAGIRDYLNSPEFRQKLETRKRINPGGDTSALECDV